MIYALKARRFFPFASRKQAASQAVKYARAIEYLGPNWKALQMVGRKDEV